MYTGILAESAGPGATFVKSCGAVPVFLLSALLCLCFELLHICFGILTFVGYRKKAYWMIGFVIVAHLAASLVVSCLLTFIGHGWKREDGRREETGLCVYVCFCCCFVFLFLVVCANQRTSSCAWLIILTIYQTILNTTHGWFGCIFVLVVTYAVTPPYNNVPAFSQFCSPLFIFLCLILKLSQILAVTGFVTARITLDVQRYNRYYQLDS